MDKYNSFPTFRKLPNGQQVFKILTERSFVEKQRIGQRVLEYTFLATQYPEMIRIKEMLQLIGYESITEQEFEDFGLHQ